MTVEILMPPLSQTSDTLVLVSWLKNIGDAVKKGENLFTVETDKATLEVEAPADGILTEILVQPQSEVKAGTCVGKIGSPQEVKSLAAATADASAIHTEEKEQPFQVLPAQTAKAEKRVFISPRAKRLMQEKGILPEVLFGKGSGPDGAIVERDVQKYLLALQHAVSQPSQAFTSSLTSQERFANVQTSALSPTRKVIAQRMLESHRTIPPVTYQREAIVTALVELRQRLLEQLHEEQPRPSLTDFFIAIACRVLMQFPLLNSTFDGEQIQSASDVHLALAVDTERGLVAPVIFKAQEKRISALAAVRADLVARAKANQLAPHEISGATFTLTNLGMLGIDSFTPIINPPQVAILGVGRIREVAVQVSGQLCFQKMINFSLTCDHRVIDGAMAARFLGAFASLVEHPEMLLY